MITIDRRTFGEVLEKNINECYKKELSHAFNITIGTENKKIVFEKKSQEYEGLSITQIKERIYSRIKKREFNELLKNFAVDEVFLEEFAPLIDWDIVSEYQQLSEDFMMLFIKEIKWNKAILFQELSEDFLENIDYLFEIKEYEPSNTILFSNGTTTVIGGSVGSVLLQGNTVLTLSGSSASSGYVSFNGGNTNFTHDVNHRDGNSTIG